MSVGTSSNRALARHLRRLGIDPEQGPTSPEQWQRFLRRLERTHEALERERYVVERSIELSNREMEALHDELRTDRGRLEAIVQALPQAVVWLDAELRVVEGNARSRSWFCRVEGTPLGGCLTLRWEDGGRVEIPTDAAALGEGWSAMDGQAETRLGVWPVSWSLRRVAGGALLVVSDNRELKAKEAELHRVRTEAEVSKRSQAARGRFLTNMSHELRTPLNAILGYAELLLDENPNPDLERIHGAGHHLLELINDLLDLSKIDAGRMVFEEHDVDGWGCMEDVADTLRPVAAENGNRIVLEGEKVLIRGDGRRIRQSLLNLVGNACKFTSNGTITLRSWAEHGRVHMEVQDTGIGISESDLTTVFERFGQADPVPGRGTGLGLGLTLALARGMGGRLDVHSTLGVGSSFVLILPMALPAEGR